jgi:hypothetical protein
MILDGNESLYDFHDEKPLLSRRSVLKGFISGAFVGGLAGTGAGTILNKTILEDFDQTPENEARENNSLLAGAGLGMTFGMAIGSGNAIHHNRQAEEIQKQISTLQEQTEKADTMEPEDVARNVTWWDRIFSPNYTSS